jgi:thioredoxin reductase
MKSPTIVAIVGAGPYGLSLAAYLNKCGIAFRIFGSPMHVWREQMPDGMHLKSDGFASNLYDPGMTFTLKNFCKERHIDYDDQRLPVRLDTFTEYAMEFQKRFVPMLEPNAVREVRKEADGYALLLENGATLSARAVVIATGISYFAYVPPSLASLPSDLCTHSSAHHQLSGFRNRRVLVIGGGASATDMAALLNRAGASVSVASHNPLKFHLPPGDAPRSLWQRIRAPNLGLGPGLRSAVYTAAPGMFHRLPQSLRQRIVHRHLGPAGGWFVKEQVIGKVQLHEGFSVESVKRAPMGAMVRLIDEHGGSREIETDHIIAATGYRVSVDRLDLLEEQLGAGLKLEQGSPKLSPSFESSIPGLYFIGVASAANFGPVMRFARGADYTAKNLSTHLTRTYASQKNEGSTQTATA